MRIEANDDHINDYEFSPDGHRNISFGQVSGLNQ